MHYERKRRTQGKNYTNNANPLSSLLKNLQEVHNYRKSYSINIIWENVTYRFLILSFMINS